MKIYSTKINEQNPPSYEILLDVLKSLNPKIEEKEIIKEIKKLGKSEATETIEKTRREGFEFTLTKDFEVFLSTKTQTNKYKFNATTRRYDPKK